MKLGNQLLYLLSEKKSLEWSQFRKCVEDIFYRQDKVSNDLDKYEIYSFARNLSSLCYLDIGENKKSRKVIVQVAPPMFVRLPLIQSTFLLTGGRSSKLLDIIESCPEVQKMPSKNKQKLLPETFIIRIKDQDLDSLIEQTIFQGNKLSNYIKVHKQPIAWDILEFAGDINQYEQSLSLEWHSGNTSDIKQFFDIKSLKFQDFNSSNQLGNNLSLVKIPHYEKFYTYYLFKPSNEDKAKVNLDWGRFIMAKQSNCPVLEYDKQTFELRSNLRFPAIFERGLTLLSGIPPIREEENKKFIFKSVPYKIAELIAHKLGQKLRFHKGKNNA